MNQEQSTAPVSQVAVQNSQRPVLVTVIAVLMMISGIIGVLGLGALFVLPELLGKSGVNQTSLLVIGASILAVISGVLTIILAIYLLKMKKWVLYVFTILFVINIIVFVVSLVAKSTTFDFENIVGYVLEAIVIAYLWSIRKQFV